MPTRNPPASPAPVDALATAAPDTEGLLERQRQLIEELQTLVNHVPYGLMVLEPGGVVRHLNAEAARQLKLQRHLAQGRRLGSLLDFDTMVEQVFLTGEGYTDRERIIATPRFQLHVLDTAIPVKAVDGRVLSVVNTFREIQGLHRLADRLAGSQARHTFDTVLGHSPALRSAVAMARKASRSMANILLTGESGTGKEVFAQAIHNESPRREGPFIAVNCAALPRDLIESELFGYAPGAFTGAQREGRPGKFEAAQGGTIFLDEVAELPLDVQAKLLRVLQEREVVRLGSTRTLAIDARVITASNRDLQAMVTRREFRADLYHRCHVIGVTLPPLRERPSDIALLAEHFLARYAAALGKPARQIPADLLALLLQHPWPGNVRELENTLERLVNLSDGEMLDTDLVAFGPATGAPGMPTADTERAATPHRQHRCAHAACTRPSARPSWTPCTPTASTSRTRRKRWASPSRRCTPSCGCTTLHWSAPWPRERTHPEAIWPRSRVGGSVVQALRRPPPYSPPAPPCAQTACTWWARQRW